MHEEGGMVLAVMAEVISGACAALPCPAISTIGLSQSHTTDEFCHRRARRVFVLFSSYSAGYPASLADAKQMIWHLILGMGQR